MTFRDLNKNGRLDPYEDPCCPIEDRVEDLLSQMTLEEKAGMMFQTTIEVGCDGRLVEDPSTQQPYSTCEMVSARTMNHFNVRNVPGPRIMAEWHNRLQALAEQTRLGIPVTIASDPRHAYSGDSLASFGAGAFSSWPDPVGLAATGDPQLVEEFADIARQEYLAVGIRVALHPMADLATEPRWGRIQGTFGEDAALSSLMIAAYIRGFQGESIGPQSVACMTKHFPGGGPQKDGEDAHFSGGREQVYPGNNFNYHLIPFESAFAAGTAQIMPYYSVPIGLPFEEVGFGFNKGIIDGLLRQRYGFDGVVCTDWWMLTSHHNLGGKIVEPLAYGVEHLSVSERAKKALDAGVDQFGGDACTHVIVDLVKSGAISEARLDVSVRRLLRDKFRLGLFDNPYVDPDAAEQIVGNPQFKAAGERAQRKSIVLLKNKYSATGRVLPLGGRPKLYVENIDPDVASAYGQVVETPGEADLAIIRLHAPYDPLEEFVEVGYHTGDLDFKGAERDRILKIMSQVPTVVDVYLDRPAVMPEIAEKSAGLLGNFGASDTAVLDMVFGRFKPSGTLPFELPSSMETVRKRRGDVPRDSGNPLFAFGHGLTYGPAARAFLAP